MPRLASLRGHLAAGSSLGGTGGLSQMLHSGTVAAMIRGLAGDAGDDVFFFPEGDDQQMEVEELMLGIRQGDVPLDLDEEVRQEVSGLAQKCRRN